MHITHNTKILFIQKILTIQIQTKKIPREGEAPAEPTTIGVGNCGKITLSLKATIPCTSPTTPKSCSSRKS
jgi:hypothetical protein